LRIFIKNIYLGVPKAYTAQIPNPPQEECVKGGADTHARHEVDTVQEGLKSHTYRMLLAITITTSCITKNKILLIEIFSLWIVLK